MLFNSIEFLFFLPICLAGVYLLECLGRRGLVLAWLLLCSLFFYGWFKPSYLLLLGASVFTNYLVGGRILRANGIQASRASKSWLVLGVVFNLALLGWFKYAGFFAETIANLTGADWSLPQILLPIGISFYTFQQIAYLMDCRDGIAHRTDFLKYSLFVSYFPQLIAGPIVHPNTLLSQFEDRRVFAFESSRFLEGLTIFILGLAKKVVLADAFGVWASEGFGAAQAGHVLSFFEAWSAALTYTFQIYFDFSGYSDMAIGLAWMIGLRLPINFESPYKARSIIDFWRRWHITLSKFLRDYLYIPLGGNRRGRLRRWINLFITMVLGGLWHGAGWTFILWGGLHGLFLAVNHFWIDFRKRVTILDRSYGKSGVILSWALTMIAVIVGWVFFRAADLDSAVRILEGMAGVHGVALPGEIAGVFSGYLPFVEAVPRLPFLAGGLRTGMVEVFGFLMIGFIIALIGKPVHRMAPRMRFILLIPAFALTMQKILVSTEPSEFLYFQF